MARRRCPELAELEQSLRHLRCECARLLANDAGKLAVACSVIDTALAELDRIDSGEGREYRQQQNEKAYLDTLFMARRGY